MLITKLSLNLPLASLNIVIMIFCSCLLCNTPALGSHVILTPLLFDKYIFCAWFNALFSMYVLPIAEVNASYSPCIIPLAWLFVSLNAFSIDL